MVKFGGILGFDNGVMLAPMGVDISGPELVAAVANAGGIGLIASPGNDYELTVKAISDTRKLTDKPFGAGILLEFEQTHTIRAIYDQKLACLQVFWGDFTKEMVDEAHKHDVKVIHQVGSVKAAERAIAAGVDCIVAQGSEAGGHVVGTVSLTALVPRIVDAVGDRKIVVVAAGSIADARGYVAALALGAQGIAVGTRFIATKEAYAHEYYKQKLVDCNEEQTDRTDLYERFYWKADVRCLRTPFYEQWKNAPDFVQNDNHQPIVGKTSFFKKEAVNLRRFSGQVMNCTTEGNLEDMVLYAGQGVGLVKDHTVSAGDLVAKFVNDAKAIIERLDKNYLQKSKKDEANDHTEDSNQQNTMVFSRL
ncbi:hypothetical protein MKW92_032622 [Papaver armeniacum]|nr:hypothetical protein MKW92_032622 [Papaver armeniacum]